MCHGTGVQSGTQVKNDRSGPVCNCSCRSSKFKVRCATEPESNLERKSKKARSGPVCNCRVVQAHPLAPATEKRPKPPVQPPRPPPPIPLPVFLPLLFRRCVFLRATYYIPIPWGYSSGGDATPLRVTGRPLRVTGRRRGLAAESLGPGRRAFNFARFIMMAAGTRGTEWSTFIHQVRTVSATPKSYPAPSAQARYTLSPTPYAQIPDALHPMPKHLTPYAVRPNTPYISSLPQTPP